jgi:hypothetical protein
LLQIQARAVWIERIKPKNDPRKMITAFTIDVSAGMVQRVSNNPLTMILAVIVTLIG